MKKFNRHQEQSDGAIGSVSQMQKDMELSLIHILVRDGRVESCGSRDEIVPMLFLDQAGCTCLDREGGNGNEAGCSY